MRRRGECFWSRVCVSVFLVVFFFWCVAGKKKKKKHHRAECPLQSVGLLPCFRILAVTHASSQFTFHTCPSLFVSLCLACRPPLSLFALPPAASVSPLLFFLIRFLFSAFTPSLPLCRTPHSSSASPLTSLYRSAEWHRRFFFDSTPPSPPGNWPVYGSGSSPARGRFEAAVAACEPLGNSER